MQHIVFGVKFVLAVLIPDVPSSVELAQRRVCSNSDEYVTVIFTMNRTAITSILVEILLLVSLPLIIFSE